jgi:hypothetical protein
MMIALTASRLTIDMAKAVSASRATSSSSSIGLSMGCVATLMVSGAGRVRNGSAGQPEVTA